ncbi:hypothetical protein VNO78_26729 [Psophocarpus tetragonolobus]|uniref:Uncharacterized protein n=1 Tax=Psophocarpus tetragonolobus TaxID=3891 RepID=A0AAN9XA41_PSOTE
MSAWSILVGMCLFVSKKAIMFWNIRPLSVLGTYVIIIPEVQRILIMPVQQKIYEQVKLNMADLLLQRVNIVEPWITLLGVRNLVGSPTNEDYFTAKVDGSVTGEGCNVACRVLGIRILESCVEIDSATSIALLGKTVQQSHCHATILNKLDCSLEELGRAAGSKCSSKQSI